MRVAWSIPDKTDPAIVNCDDTKRSIVDSAMGTISSYCRVRIDESSNIQICCIDALLCVVDFLYQYQDLDPIYFTLLDNSVTRLKALLTQDTDKETLAVYLEKAAIIFQTAADKTRIEPEQVRNYCRDLWTIEAQQYSREALKIRGQELTVTHNERMRDLYKRFADSERAFTKELLLKRYQEYQKKCENPIAVQETTATETSAPSPKLLLSLATLVGGISAFFSGSSDAGLRRRHGFRSSDSGTAEAAETMSPLLTPTAPT